MAAVVLKNKLTAEEIAEADGIIVACDKNVPTERFAGKPVLFVKVADGINKPKELIEEILSGKVAVFKVMAKYKKMRKLKKAVKALAVKFISI